MIIKPLIRSLIQRIYKNKSNGVTSYYLNGFESRISAAEWQISRCTGNCLLEIGCGKDLHTSLVAAIRFNKKAIAFDVTEIADWELINYTAKRLGCMLEICSPQDLKKIGVNYIVADSIDGISGYDEIVSTAVFEHIPIDALNSIFNRAAKIGVKTITANIDFTDHWSYIESVRGDAFYYISEFTWKILNNNRMYQNRLRFSDISNMAISNGFRLSEIEKSIFNFKIDEEKLNDRFKRYSLSDLEMRQCLVKWDFFNPND